MTTQEIRFNAAVAEAQGKGVAVHPNYNSCCRSCGFAKLDQDHEEQGYAFFINQQGHEIRFRDGKPFNVEIYYDDDFEDYEDEDAPATMKEYFRRAHHMYWYFSETEAARVISNAFKNQGFVVQWDGTDFGAVKVIFEP